MLPFVFLIALILWEWIDMLRDIYAKRHPNAPSLATRIRRSWTRVQGSRAWRWLEQADPHLMRILADPVHV
jgi:hypothetical protein